MATADSDVPQPLPPQNRHPREIVASVRVNFSRDEARMLRRLQGDWDVPYAVLLRLILRDEYHRSYGKLDPAPGSQGDT